MPSPIGHYIIGLCIYALINKNLNFRKNWKEMLLYIFMANLPDLDALPQFFGVSIPFVVHREIFHSIGFAVVVAALLAIFISIAAVPSRNYAPKFMILFMLVFSHPLVDLFTVDHNPPPGALILWPVSAAHYISPWRPLPGVHHMSFRELFSPVNIPAYLIELEIFSILFVLVYLYLVFVLQPEIAGKKRH